MLHYTAMQSATEALQRLCDPVAEVSAHYLIAADGSCWQMVAEHMRAWHAGAGEWCGCDDINSRSIGIELDNRGDHPFAEPQMAALEALMSDIMARWAMSPEGVIGHSDMAPGRKSDPGPRFDWPRLARQGLAEKARTSSPPTSLDAALFRAIARDRGYTAPVADDILLATVRLRHRPWANGPLCAADFQMLGH